MFEPGKSWAYSDSWNLLFNIMEKTTKKDIHVYAKEVLLDKIGMNHSYYKSSKLQLYIFRQKNKPSYKDWRPYQPYSSTGAATDKKYAFTTFDNELWEQLNLWLK